MSLYMEFIFYITIAPPHISYYSDHEEWLCPTCCAANLWIVSEIRGKSRKKHEDKMCVHYLCHWQGYDTDYDSYEPLAHIPAQSRPMVNEFNRMERDRKRAEAVASGSEQPTGEAKRARKE